MREPGDRARYARTAHCLPVLARSSQTGRSVGAEGPVIIMSQRRQRVRDRERARADYRVNLKAELEIQYLDEKVDLLLASTEALRAELAALREERLS